MTKTELLSPRRDGDIPPEFPFQGAFIDAEGREIPITETMILEACRRLETASSTIYPHAPSAPDDSA